VLRGGPAGRVGRKGGRTGAAGINIVSITRWRDRMLLQRADRGGGADFRKAPKALASRPRFSSFSATIGMRHPVPKAREVTFKPAPPACAEPAS